LTLIFTAGCKTKNYSNNIIFAVDSSAIPTDSTVLYFPIKPASSFPDTSYSMLAIDSFLNTWYSNQLYHLSEPVLTKYDPQREVYRFTWLRSFNHPITVRIESLKDEKYVTVKICDGNGGFRPGKIILNKMFPINESQWKELQLQFDKLKFWNLPPTKRDQNGTDGADWILEAKRKTIYHFATRWSPQNGEFRHTCDYIIKLARFSDKDLPQEDIY
jgi:hypothetical protein